jgi:hypothetical protein
MNRDDRTLSEPIFHGTDDGFVYVIGHGPSREEVVDLHLSLVRHNLNGKPLGILVSNWRLILQQLTRTAPQAHAVSLRDVLLLCHGAPYILREIEYGNHRLRAERNRQYQAARQLVAQQKISCTDTPALSPSSSTQHA